MVCASDGGWSRYTSPVFSREAVGPWTLAEPKFAGNRGGQSGPAFLPLPTPQLGEPTHIISDGSRSLYSVGTTSAGDASFNVTGSFATDFGVLMWTAAGVDDATGRILQVGWLNAGNDGTASNWCPKIQGIKVCGVQALSIVRVLEYEGRFGQLTSNPPTELFSLHNGTLASERAVTLQPNQQHQVPLVNGAVLVEQPNCGFVWMQCMQPDPP